MSPDVGRPRPAHVRALARREFRTVLRTRLFALLALGYAGIVVGFTLLAAPAGYLPAVLDLVLPHEALVPVLAFALGYRAILGDFERGELETIRTFPVSPGTYVLGVYAGRAVALLGVVLAALVAVGVAVALGGKPQVSVVAAHATVDTPVAFLRFVVLTAAFALVALAVAMLVSTVARSIRAGIALATAVVAMLVVGIDGGLLVAVAGGVVPPDLLTGLLALSPNAAYRSLVFALAVAPTGATELPVGAATLPAALGLGLWFVASLAVARVAVFRS